MAPGASSPRVCRRPTPSAAAAAAASGTASAEAITPSPAASAGVAAPPAGAAASAPRKKPTSRAASAGPVAVRATIAAVIAAADARSRLNATSPRRRDSSSRFGVGSSVGSPDLAIRDYRRESGARYFFGPGAPGPAAPGPRPRPTGTRPRPAARRLLHQRRLIERLGRLRDLRLRVLPGRGELEPEPALEGRVLLLLPLQLHQPDRQHPLVDPEVVRVAGRRWSRGSASS